MRRVLVPLDGSTLATNILPDAQRLAGSEGEIVLMHDVAHPGHDPLTRDHEMQAFGDANGAYLDVQAAKLRERGANVQVQTVVLNDVSLSIDEAARIFGADVIACATHGRGPVGRLIHGGVVWRALAHSAVPVMVRHFEEDVPDEAGVSLAPRRILVPLDGSALAETALPLATALAEEWHAPLFLMYVVPQVRPSGNPYGYMYITPSTYEAEVRQAQQYLDTVRKDVAAETHTRVVVGDIVHSLMNAVDDLSITEVVMSTHGRTGLSRVILGSVTDALVQHLTCPIIVIPAMEAKRLETTSQVWREAAAASV